MQSSIQCADPVVPPAPSSSGVAPQQQPDRTQKVELVQPVSVSFIRDDELSRFEKKTVTFGRWGLIVAGLSFVAACTAAYFVYEQFAEMNLQTGILSATAERARVDSNESGNATARQLAALQAQVIAARDQLVQGRRALELDQRPWLKFEMGGDQPKDAELNNGRNRLLTTIAGQPIKIETRITNIGKTTAERIIGTLIVQYVPKGKKPTLFPRRGKSFRIGHGSCHNLRGGIPAFLWDEATLYPNEVSQVVFSRAKCGKDGIVEDDPITESERAELDRHNAYILVSGEVWYSDIFGVRHWTRFCGISDLQLDPFVATDCIAFGAVDANQPRGTVEKLSK